MIHRNEDSDLPGTLRRVLGNPWVICLLLAALTTGLAWIVLDRDMRGYWKRLSIATAFGFSLGLVQLVELKVLHGVLLKRILGAGIGLGFAIFATCMLNPTQDMAFMAWFLGIVLGACAREWSQYLALV
jgi:hypothetical protein